MPIHKNTERGSRVTMAFSDSFDITDSDWEISGITQDWFSVTEATLAATPNTSVVNLTVLDSTITTPVITASGDTIVFPWVDVDGNSPDVRTAAESATVVHGWLNSYDTTTLVPVSGGTDLDFVGRFTWTLSGNVITGVQKVGLILATPHPVTTDLSTFFLNTGRSFTEDQGANYYSQSLNRVTFEIANTGGRTDIFNRGDLVGSGTGFVPINGLNCSAELINGAAMEWVADADSLQSTGVSTDILFVDLLDDFNNVVEMIGTVIQESDYTQTVDSSGFGGTITLNNGTWEDLGFNPATEVIGGVTVLTTRYFFNFGDIARSNEVGTPDWTGRVATLYSEGSNTLVQVDVLTGASNLEEAKGTDGTLIDNSILDRLFEQQEPTVNVGILDAKTANDSGYTFFGDVTNEDFYGGVSTGSEVNVYNTLQMALTVVTDTSSDFYDINNIPSNALSSEASITRMRFRTNNESPITGGGTFIFVNIPSTTANNPLAKVTEAASILNAQSGLFRGLNVVATVSGTTSNATLTIRPRNTSISWTGTGITEVENNWTGNLGLNTETLTEDITLSLANDPNRTGDSTGINFSNSLATSDHTTWDDIEFARGATVTLDKGFKLNIGQGYDFTGDAKDGSLTIAENAKLLLSYDSRDDIWGGKDGATPHRTAAHPFTVNKLSGGQLVLANIERNRTGSGGQNVTFLNGENAAATGIFLNSLIFNTNNSGTGFYSDKVGFYYPMPGENINNQIVVSTDLQTTFYEPSPNIKQFDGDKIIHNSGTLQFNASPGAFGTVANFDFASQWIACDMDFSGDVIEDDITTNTPLGAFQSRNNNFYFVDLTRANEPYVGDWTWSEPGSGRTRMTRRWNPSWKYLGDSLSDIYESYYYQDKSQGTLVTVKEGGESNAINTVGTQTHPFSNGITTSSTVGLAQVILSNSLPAYTPDGTNWPLNKPGLCLTYLDGSVPALDDHTDTFDSNNGTAFSYTRRDGFRPYFTSIDMTGPKTDFNPITDFDPLLDPYWQADTIADIDAYTAEATAAGPGTTFVRTVDTSPEIATAFVTRGNWNDNYRFIEHHENYDNIHRGRTSDNLRPNTSELNGLFRRLIDTDNPVNSKGLMNINQGHVVIFPNTDQTISTEANAIRGIDAGSQNIVVAHNIGNATLSFTGDLDTTGGLIVESHTTDGVMTLADSVFNIGGTMQVTVIVNGTSGDTISLDDCTVNAGTFTFGGPYRTFPEATDPTYTANRTTFNVINDITFTDELDTVTVNTTADINVNGTAEDCNFGSDTQSAGDVDYGTTATAARNLVYATTITLPATVTSGTFVATGAIDTDSLVNACTTATITGNGITLGDLTTCTIDGLTSDVTAETVSATAITNAGDVDVQGLVNGSSVTATGTVTSTGDVSDSTISTANLVINTSDTSFSGDIAIATVTNSATILTLGD